MSFLRAAFLLSGALFAGVAGPLRAQEAEQPDANTSAPTANTEDGVPAGRGRSFDPAYFAQYGPRNALDMVSQIPGFTISNDGGGQRGLGQANQNVLVNGERFSSKSDSIRDQLQRIAASEVVRIDLVDGTTLDIPGLTGQVANVIVAEGGGGSGQFRYRAGFRAHNTQPQLYGGEVSWKARAGALEYTVSLKNDNDRFGADGPITLTDGTGALIETQDTRFSGGFDNPILAANLTYRPSDTVLANLNLRYGRDYYFRDDPEIGFPVIGAVRTRLATVRERGPEYEVGGDVEFPLGPGRLKLIGLERFEKDIFESVVVDGFSDGSASVGSRFTQTNDIGERIGRFEYGWRMFSADWQLAGEAAFNRLDRTSGLFDLATDGEFVAVPFPAGTGGVTEDRYETILSFSKQLTGKLAFQATAGGEYSKIEQTGSAANSRSFQRPKGSASLAWRPAANFDASLKLSRSVGQLSFGNFLASVALNDENQNAGNNALEPSQNWKLEFQANRRFGPWGSVTFELERTWFEDFIDFFPLIAGGEARGNVGDADATVLETNATVKFDPVGWIGAQLDLRAAIIDTSVIDPFTGEARFFSNNTIDFLELDFRHDISQSQWAYGASYFTNRNAFYSRRFEIGRNQEGPGFLDLFVENKDVLGTTVNFTVANILDATQNFERTVFLGDRPDAPIAFSEISRRRIGPIFRLTVSGNF
ncbi:TonB-dependent receptor plug domain-containing protein [Qipengyuania spongiae]|uniref:TonB-dependent receptor plug domain-containing protein n=1 Tax=Qipengyuania spongiae TaxID=2909673 RepID=A0ABY5T1Z6_9SPHN|nr:hypothetical protein [Qipengyuania spongiae]UVI39276.1 hypothetical protein L1F33_13770 [Qipengyuania spongiae]